MNKFAQANKYTNEGIQEANRRNFPEAIALFKKALEFNEDANIYYFLGLSSHMLGKRNDAQKYYSKAITLNPDFSMAYNNYGTISLEKKDFEEAVDYFKKSIEADINNSFAYSNLGNAYKSFDKMDEAIENWNKAIEINPNLPEAYNNLGVASYSQKKIKEAINYLQKATQIEPNYPPPYYHLGIIYAKENDASAAVKFLQKYLGINPRDEDAQAFLGNIFMNSGQIENAIASFEKALEINPKFSFGLNDLGNLYKQIGKYDLALTYYQEAIEYSPTLAGTYSNMGVIYFNQNKYDLALSCFNKAVKLDPACATAYYQTGLIYERRHQLKLAADNLNKAFGLDPNLAEALNVLSYILMQTCDFDSYEKRTKELDRITEQEIKGGSKISETPFLSVIRKDNPEINSQVAALMSKRIKRLISNALPPFTFNDRKNKKKIRIGYISNDFYDHATAHLILRLFETHNRDKFEIYAYSYGPDDRSSFRKKIVDDCDNFVDISKLGHIEAAQTIFQDKVDILVDLKGYTRDARMEIPALRPAPIQISWLGFPGTTGADFFDYTISDKITTPPEITSFFSEKIIFMPNSYQINDNRRKISSTKYKRSDFGLPENKFIFSSFNHTYKIDPKTFEIWMKILKKVKGSVLWLLESNAYAVGNLKKEAKKHDIDPERIIFSGVIPNSEHLSRISLSDLALDSFICNGHTTTSDALWARVPVITLQGKHFASRVSSSLLSAIGLPELITKTAKQYEDLAISLATNPKKLQTTTYKLQTNKKTHPLFDTEKFVSSLEKAYNKIWENYLNNGKPKNFEVK